MNKPRSYILVSKFPSPQGGDRVWGMNDCAEMGQIEDKPRILMLEPKKVPFSETDGNMSETFRTWLANWEHLSQAKRIFVIYFHKLILFENSLSILSLQSWRKEMRKLYSRTWVSTNADGTSHRGSKSQFSSYQPNKWSRQES